MMKNLPFVFTENFAGLMMRLCGSEASLVKGNRIQNTLFYDNFLG